MNLKVSFYMNNKKSPFQIGCEINLEISYAIWYIDGLYILLRAHNKNNKNCITKNNITCKLNHLIMNCEPKKGCYWRLSGPQIPSPTRVQQRYW